MDNFQKNDNNHDAEHAETGHENGNITSSQRAAFKKLFNKYKEEVKSEFERIQADINAIEKFRVEYLDGTDEKQSIKARIDLFNGQIGSKFIEAKTKHEEIVKLYDELFKGTSTTDSIEVTINDLVESSEKKVEAIESKKKEIEDFYEKVFGKESNPKSTIEGYKQKFDNEIKRINEFFKAQQEKYNTQFEQIQSLLPGATSIGLAKAFEDQKKSYGNSIIVWSFVFVFTMLGMISFGIYYIVEISKITDLDVSKALIAIINKLPFFVPTVWLAIYASKQQSQNKRLQQEYAFKETFAKSYDGQKTQLEKLDITDEEANQILKNLLENLVNITSHNPSNTLESEKHNEKVPLVQGLENLLSKKSKPEKEEE